MGAIVIEASSNERNRHRDRSRLLTLAPMGRSY